MAKGVVLGGLGLGWLRKFCVRAGCFYGLGRLGTSCLGGATLQIGLTLRETRLPRLTLTLTLTRISGVSRLLRSF